MMQGEKNVRYAYFVKKSYDTNWLTIKDYSTATSVEYTPGVATKYDFLVKIKKSDNTVLRKTINLTVDPSLVNQSKIDKTTIAKGNEVVLTGAAKGGSGSYTYGYYYKRASGTAWKCISDYSKTTKVKFRPTTQETYYFSVKVKDSNGRIIRKDFKTKVVAALVNRSTISASSVMAGDSVTVSGDASGGTGKFTYKYAYRTSPNSAWMLAVDYSSNSTTVIFQMPGAGDYEFFVRAKDSAGNIATKYFNVSVANATVDAMVDHILGQIITSSMTDFEKIKAIHDWLVNNAEYDTEGVNSGNVPSSSYTAEGLLKTRVAVCDGYAKTFLIMAQRAGLEALRVTGTADNGSGVANHAWNQVKADGKWYNIDVTWDDPVVSANYGDNLMYTYFLIPDSVLNKNHTPSGTRNSCTTAQPVNWLLPLLKASESSQKPNFSFHDTETGLKQAVANVSATRTATYTMVLKTTKGQAELFEIVRSSLPSGSYGVSFNTRPWKLSGYKQLNLTITV